MVKKVGNVEFKTVEDLYKRLTPALYSKKEELRRNNINYIKEEDIWNYLVKNVWSNKKGLSLNDLTRDILYLDGTILKNYMLNKLSEEKRKIESSDTLL